MTVLKTSQFEDIGTNNNLRKRALPAKIEFTKEVRINFDIVSQNIVILRMTDRYLSARVSNDFKTNLYTYYCAKVQEFGSSGCLHSF